MTDPVTRTARRQNCTDRLAEQLTAWGSPPDIAHTRAAGLLHLVEAHGWTLPPVTTPPPAGPGSTVEGRARARLIADHTRRGCRCPSFAARALPPAEHPPGCPVRDAHGTPRTGLAAPLP